MLWLEFAEMPVDPQDAYFVRVLAGADPCSPVAPFPRTRPRAGLTA